VPTATLNLPPQGVIVIWEWEWLQDEDNITHVSESILSCRSHNSHENNAMDADSDAMDTDSDATNCSPMKLSTVTFKCIGCQHDPSAQKILEMVSESLDEEEVVPVNIFSEEDNPYDANAIAFKCWMNNEWKRIRYVVKEACDAVHDARRNSAITEVAFKWVKFMAVWERSGPAFYTGINIIKSGEWTPEVHRCASTQ